MNLTSSDIHKVLSSSYALSKTNRAFEIHCENDFNIFLEKHENGAKLGIPIKLRGDWVTDEVLARINGATKVNLSKCDRITDKDLRYL